MRKLYAILTLDIDTQICLLAAEADRGAGDLASDAAVCSLVRRQHARFHGLIESDSSLSSFLCLSIIVVMNTTSLLVNNSPMETELGHEICRRQ